MKIFKISVMFLSLLFLLGIGADIKTHAQTASAPTATISVDKTSLSTDNTNTTLNVTWSSTNADACFLSSDDFITTNERLSSTTGVFSIYGWSSSLLPRYLSPGSWTLSIRCFNNNGQLGQGNASVTLPVVAPAGAPTVTLSVSPSTVVWGNTLTSTLTWSTTGATSCTGYGGNTNMDFGSGTIWDGSNVPVSGSQAVSFSKTFTSSMNAPAVLASFSLLCVNDSGVSSRSNFAKVTVTPIVPIETSTTFLLPRARAELVIGNTQTIKWSTKGITNANNKFTNNITLSRLDPVTGSAHVYNIAHDVPISGSIEWKVGSISTGSYNASSDFISRGIQSDGPSVPAGEYTLNVSIGGTNAQGDAVTYGSISSLTITNVESTNTGGTSTTGIGTSTTNTGAQTNPPSTAGSPDLNQNSLTPSSNNYNFGTTTLKRGSRGNAVMQLQKFFNIKLNLNLIVDGKLGLKTVSAIKQWQRDHGLKEDGRVGPKTKAAMNGEGN